MGNQIHIARLHQLVTLCVAIILLSIVLHLIAEVTCGSPYLINVRQNATDNKNVVWPRVTCHLLDSLALPIIVLVLIPNLGIFLLACPHLIHWDWSPPPPVRPPLCA